MYFIHGSGVSSEARELDPRAEATFIMPGTYMYVWTYCTYIHPSIRFAGQLCGF